MPDASTRKLERDFEAEPTPHNALALAQAATRERSGSTAWPAFCVLLTLGVWDSLDQAARRSVAQLVGSWTDARGLTFTRLRDCRQQAIAREIAFFTDQEGRDFALIPGGRVEIGYDPKTFDPSQLNAELQEYARDVAREWEEDGPEAVAEELGRVEDSRLAALAGINRLRPKRSVDLRPLLVEARPEALWEQQRSHRSVVSSLRAEGYRLPASDEWEFLCAAGTKTLFRWGDQFPAGENEPEALEPNAFGLHFHASPAGSEFCLEPEKSRNGDGGVGLCGGEGPVAFLPLSPWYEGQSRFDRPGLARRVLDLSDCLVS